MNVRLSFDFIKKDTTPEQFEAELAKVPNYTLTQLDYSCQSAFQAASICLNFALMSYIIDQGGKEVSNLRSRGVSPLADCCILYERVPLNRETQKRTVTIIKKLIANGANVNESISLTCPWLKAVNYTDRVWKKRKLTVEHKIELIKLLARSGCKIDDAFTLDECASAKKRAKYEEIEKTVQEHIRIDNANSATACEFWKVALITTNPISLHALPFELLAEIASYLPENPCKTTFQEL